MKFYDSLFFYNNKNPYFFRIPFKGFLSLWLIDSRLANADCCRKYSVRLVYGDAIDELLLDVAELTLEFIGWKELSEARRLTLARLVSTEFVGLPFDALAWILAPKLVPLFGVANPEILVQVSTSSDLDRVRL